MRRLLIVMVSLWFAALPALAAEPGYTYRATELKEKPFLDARINTLAEQTRVEIITRQGAWMQVKASDSGLARSMTILGCNATSTPSVCGLRGTASVPICNGDSA